MPRRRATAQPDNVEEPKVEVVEEVIASKPETKEPKPRTVKSEVGVVETKEQPQPVQHREGVPDGIILGPKEPIRIEGDDNGTSIIVKTDIYRETYPPRAKRPSYVLVYAKGTEILKSRLVPLPKEAK